MLLCQTLLRGLLMPRKVILDVAVRYSCEAQYSWRTTGMTASIVMSVMRLEVSIFRRITVVAGLRHWSAD